MVRKTVIFEVVELLHREFFGTCATLAKIVEYLKEKGLYVSYTTVRHALEIMVRLGKAEKHKLNKSYTFYCFGEPSEYIVKFDYDNAEKCIMKLMPSATLLQIAECILKTKPRSDYTTLYLSIIYTLMRMIKEGKIHSVILISDTRDKFKIIIQQ
jgi:nitric oxide synthase oxygenase domain/subunit